MITRRQFLKGIAAESVALAISSSWNPEAFSEGDLNSAERLSVEETDGDCVTILGTRGSMPVSGKDFLRYGGATVCVLARLDGEYIILDAGTGTARQKEEVI